MKICGFSHLAMPKTWLPTVFSIFSQRVVRLALATKLRNELPNMNYELSPPCH